MSASADVVAASTSIHEAIRMVGGARWVVRGIQRIFGAALVCAAVALWLMPGAGWQQDIMLFKLVLSVVALGAGIGLLQSSARPPAPAVEIDSIRREIRLVRLAKRGKPTILQRCAFKDLARVEQNGAHLRFWGADGGLFAEFTISDRGALDGLMAWLRDAGKLA